MLKYILISYFLISSELQSGQPSRRQGLRWSSGICKQWIRLTQPPVSVKERTCFTRDTLEGRWLCKLALQIIVQTWHSSCHLHYTKSWVHRASAVLSAFYSLFETTSADIYESKFFKPCLLPISVCPGAHSNSLKVCDQTNINLD